MESSGKVKTHTVWVKKSEADAAKAQAEAQAEMAFAMKNFGIPAE